MPTSSYWPLPRSELYRWPGGGGGGGGAPKTQKRKNPKNAADTMSEATAIVSEAEEGSVLRRRVPAARTVAIDSGGSDTPPEDSSRGHQVFLEAPLPHTNTGLPTFVLGHARNSRSKLRPQRHPLVGAAGTMVPQSVAPAVASDICSRSATAPRHRRERGLACSAMYIYRMRRESALVWQRYLDGRSAARVCIRAGHQYQPGFESRSLQPFFCCAAFFFACMPARVPLPAAATRAPARL